MSTLEASQRGGASAAMRAGGFLPAVVVLASVGLSLRVGGLVWAGWGSRWPFLARHCVVGVLLELLVLGLARRGQINWAIVVIGLDYVAMASLAPRFGTGSELFLYGLLHPFLVLGITRWPIGVRTLLGLVPPTGFLALRLGATIPMSTGLVGEDQLHDLATLNSLVFVGLCLTMAVSSLRVSESISRRAERLAEGRSQLIDDMGHELRNPSAVLLIAAQTALARERSATEYQRSLRVIERHSRELGQTVRRMLELSRLERDEVVLEARDDLAIAMREIVAGFAEDAERSSVSFAVEIPPIEDGTDAAALRIVLGNLLSNAIRHSPPGGRIHVELVAEKSDRRITIRDEGPGIAPGDLPHIFARYWRADKARTRDGGQLGLGLSIARRYARFLGADLSARSPPGSGAIFTLSWRSRQRAEPPAEAQRG